MRDDLATGVLWHDETRRLRLSDRLARLAMQALIAEAELTPKPGLVDRRGAGAHCDLSLELLRRSASVLEPYFSSMAFASIGRAVDPSLREELALIGREAERAMYQATGGSNAHKGAIWSLGLLVAAAARKECHNAQQIAASAGAIARVPDHVQPALFTHGDIARIRYGAGGARSEAANNFPHVVAFGLPILRWRRAAGASELVSRLDVLLGIMSDLDDTCVLYRAGVEGLEALKSGAHAVLIAGGYGSVHGRNLLHKLNRGLIARHISPGGTADLLAATIFLDAIERQQSEISDGQSEWEARDGTA
jgi:triphosphoribosyl-dephospho-CoA synthase